jgi:phosphoribosylamine--glycine ligase
MIADDGVPRMLEYNCRFGDPETQAVLPRLQGDFGALLLGAAIGCLPAGRLEWDTRTSVCVVLASKGYPGKVSVGASISTLPEQALVFHAGTKREGAGLVTCGGRVLSVVAMGKDVDSAREVVYPLVKSIEFDGRQMRTDIGKRGEP